MGADPRPEPVVTIVDPARPGWLHDVVVAPEAPRRGVLRTVERLLVGALTALLVVGLAGAHELRDVRAQAARLAALHLVAVPTAGGPVLDADPHETVLLRLDGTGRLAVPIRRFAAAGGWRPLGVPPQALGVGEEIGLRHDLSCDAALALPARLTVEVEVDGHRHELRVPVAKDRTGRMLDVSGLCGDLPATEAVALSSSSITARGPHSEVLLRLVNTGVADVTVEGVGFPGFALRPSSRLPLHLPGRPSGLLRFRALLEHPLVLDARVADCGRAGFALAAARNSGTPDLLAVRASGRGGSGTVALDVQGLEDFLEQAWLATCPEP